MPLTYLYTEHLWFESLGHSDVFWGLQQIQWGIFAVCFLGALGFMSMNAAIANVLCPESSEFRRWTHTQTFSFHRSVFCLTLVAAFLLATPMLLLDDVYLRYQHQPNAADSNADRRGRETAPTALGDGDRGARTGEVTNLAYPGRCRRSGTTGEVTNLAYPGRCRRSGTTGEVTNLAYPGRCRRSGTTGEVTNLAYQL